MTSNKQQFTKELKEILEVLSGEFRIGNDKDRYTINRDKNKKRGKRKV